MTEGDLRDVLTIESRSFSLPWNEEMFKSELSLDFSRNFTAKLSYNGTGDILVGYICFWLLHGEAHLLNIAVQPDHRRMGLGARLMRFFVDYCRNGGVKILTLEVRSSNYPAILMYRKTGFRKEGTRPHYYADNHEDALIMGLRLTEG
jgi:ribosomal-protein-alanine N-acetyltransferase